LKVHPFYLDSPAWHAVRQKILRCDGLALPTLRRHGEPGSASKRYHSHSGDDSELNLIICSETAILADLEANKRALGHISDLQRPETEHREEEA
jgi:hypothetical protein